MMMIRQEREKLRESIAENNTCWRTSYLHPDIVLALLDHIDALEGIVTNLAAPIYSDEKSLALTRYLNRNNPNWASEKLHEFALRAKAAIAKVAK